jgi:type II secretory pathway pseudopilin PulG
MINKLNFKIYERAFTLIELLVVVAIVGIIATAVLLSIDPIKKINAAKDAIVKSDLNQIVNTLQLYYTNSSNSQYPSVDDGLEMLVQSGEIETLPRQQTGVASCTDNAGEKGAGENYCYNSTGDTAILWSVLPSDKTKSYCWDSFTGTYKVTSIPAFSAIICPAAISTPTPTSAFPTSILTTTPTPPSASALVYTAGWRSSDYGMEDPQAACQGPGAYDGECTIPASYWVDVAQKMATKFPGSEPGGVYTIGYIHNMGTAMPYELQSTLGTMTAVTYTGEGMQADPELMFDAFDAAGLKVLIGIEPGNADINVLANKLLNKYKHHSSLLGMSLDAEWYKSESGSVKMTTANITDFRNAIEAVNSNYITVVKHYDSSKLTAGVPRVVYLTDTCNFRSLAAAVDDYVAWADTFSANRVGYQLGYDKFEVGTPDDQLWWGPLGTGGQPAVVITNAILAQRPGTEIFMIYWADFTMDTQFPIP